MDVAYCCIVGDGLDGLLCNYKPYDYTLRSKSMSKSIKLCVGIDMFALKIEIERRAHSFVCVCGPITCVNNLSNLLYCKSYVAGAEYAEKYVSVQINYPSAGELSLRTTSFVRNTAIK